MRRYYRRNRLRRAQEGFKKGDVVNIESGFAVNEGPNLFRPLNESSIGIVTFVEPDKDTMTVFISSLNRDAEVPKDRVKKLNVSGR